MPSIRGEVVSAIHQLYGRQAHRIDSGDAEGWAATFTPDGVFSSPTYPRPVTGAAELVAFAEQFRADGQAAGEVRRHVVTTIAVEAPTADAGDGVDELGVQAYLQVVATPIDGPPRLLRLTTLADRVVRYEGDWRVRTRTVRRDDLADQQIGWRGER